MIELGHLARLLGVLLALLVSPVVLVWPRASARLLVPSRARRRLAARPRVWVWVVAAPLAVASALSMSDWVLGAMVHPHGLPHPAQALALIWVLFGGLTLAAFSRAVRIGAREWAITRPLVPMDGSRLTDAVIPPSPSFSYGSEYPIEQRPAIHQTSRRLRGTARWLGAFGLAWYLFGRALQAAHLGTGDSSDVPGWWWAVTLALVVAGAGVWLGRRVIRRTATGSPGSGAELSEVFADWGYQVSRPGGEWVRSFAPEAFVSGRAVAGPSLWPWAALGSVAGRTVLVTQQVAQVRNRTGLTATRTRTVCAIKIAGAKLPTVIVTGRESVPAAALPKSIDLELVTFNRSLWAWGPDPRGFHDVLHPRAMGPILRHLPDGASVTFGGDHIAVYNDEPVRSADLASYVELAHRLADLLPTYLVQL